MTIAFRHCPLHLLPGLTCLSKASSSAHSMRKAASVIRRATVRVARCPAHSRFSPFVTRPSRSLLSLPVSSFVPSTAFSASTPSTSSSSSGSSAPRQDVRSLLKRPSLFRESNYLNGRWVSPSSGEASIPVDNPSTRAILGHVPSTSAASVDAAFNASALAQSKWAALTPHERGRVVQRWCDLLHLHSHDLGVLMSLEQGKPVQEAVGEIVYAAGFLAVYAGEASRQYGDIIPSPTPSSRIFVTYEPVGVVAAITPWNFPAAMITRKAGAAIAAGCSVVLKPSELTPFTALALADLALEAGLPENVFQVVTGDAAEVGPVFTSHPLVRKVTFTGSTRVGKMLIEQSASTVKRTSMELGGNAPLIVFPDADVEVAVKGIMASKFRNCGQTCVTVNRVFVHSSLMDDVVERVQKEVEKLKVGDGMAAGSDLGPLINSASVEKVERHIRDALSKGAKVVYGGRRLTHTDSALIPANASDLYFAPTLVTGATDSMEAFEEETFGPVAFFYLFEEEAEVVERANNTKAGLAGYFFTKDVARADRVARALQYGMVGVNQGTVSVPTAPFGGMKESGFGREGSHHGLTDYLNMKTTHVNVG